MTQQITALLNWYDEDPKDLGRVVHDVHRLGAKTLIAVDGAYANFPGGRPRSSAPQHYALFNACAHLGIALINYVPRDVWIGDEVAKRQMLLDLAGVMSPDWLLIYDADFDLIQCDVDMPELLDAMDDDVMGLDISFTTAPHTRAGDHRARLFMAYRPGMRMGGNHYTYVYDERTRSKILSEGSSATGRWTDAIRVFHRHEARDPERHAAQTGYYEIRDGQGLETP